MLFCCGWLCAGERNGNEWPDNLLQPQGHDNNDPPHDASMSCKLLHSLILYRAACALLSCCIEQPAHFSLVASSSPRTSLLLHRAARALLSCCIEQPAHFSLVASSSLRTSLLLHRAACTLLCWGLWLLAVRQSFLTKPYSMQYMWREM